VVTGLSGKTTREAGQPLPAGDMEPKPEMIGVGVIVVRGDYVLFGLRRGAHGAGTWSFPGGHRGRRERRGMRPARARRGDGLLAVNPHRVGETKDVFPEGLHHRTFFVQVDWAGGEPVVCEPQACERWSWFSWDDTPEPLFLPIASPRAAGFRP
jgi:8-oxo-dGTP diphosphatase